MFRSLANQFVNPVQGGGASSAGDSKKAMAPTLRSDVYSAIDMTKAWLTGGLGRGQAGDGVSYQSILTLAQKHFPDLNLGLESVGQTESEVALVIGGVTNMVLELSKWEGMAGAMAMSTWTDALVEGHRRVDAESRKGLIANGITRGLNYNTDMALMTKEFTAKIQIISSLKSGELVYFPPFISFFALPSFFRSSRRFHYVEIKSYRI
ncbi:hypothetical protein EST38_g5123 [Candolleomyces aberdarensis]|uniref:Uncharacterized protein n=1 Tax=Candolleomyces aberdarensis TaxID=2316362 RepID=A0A4Q2DKU7_9AGAR|nr:hypothetical protein EST38_g5123 [Candolleomyces aberdarensis]